MSLIQAETYDAFLAAGAPEPEARAAAEVAANMDVRHTTMAERLNGIDAKLTLMLWVMGIGFSVMLGGFAATFAAFWQIFLRLPR